MALVRHVCKETSGLESLFLISKSNCAFANFKDEQACSVAQKLLHDSKFQSARLVSRLRKGTMEGLKYNTAAGPGSTPSTSHENSDAESAMDDVENKVAAVNGDAVAKAASPQPARRNSQNHSHVDRFFILKSLTTEDLDLSVQSGIWATQSHNEENLNQAFQVSGFEESKSKSGTLLTWIWSCRQPIMCISYSQLTNQASTLDMQG
jgi:hypothetical protein